ncbi:serine/threonine protein kinase [Aetokthonos hydrillicola Thurmond2011]|jgi:WD40 repeat protein/predicted Ser/Thr protein kinase|uniref:Serine/threonine protein kinase n=1 Tax=Aetokthonos hydrillicola Thurmond2011 TaxID=2712845 RepID=A0AAP5I7A1_9CYAN|nr:serine/threonine-protein kinase [Aetokthonos hydrillicola]MBO3460830.1 protein kinase [Aetokthonos hydrillicola CCALA 1050]MBW4585623.1 serine/threonine protein kinase [Aetokthonos hydrillicola CCALA 1050]MDR9894523.1 serine/threonine protein kinase [Aetokthonos hydrillicola Thurmond2011]
MVWNPGQQLFEGRYVIERKLGEGGIGITYLARNKQRDLRVIKTLKEEIRNNPDWKPYQTKLKQDFRDEATRLAVCRHPHIVEIETIFDEFNIPCIAMEYVEGEDLGKRLEKKGPLSESEAVLYIQQIGEALTVIHRKGLLHRDIKPSNIMIRKGKLEAVLIDFGIAREFVPNVVQKHTVYRTPGFAPLEQYELEAPRGEYIDVYGLAATLYSLITSRVPTSAYDRAKNIPLIPPQRLNPKISDKVNQAVIRGMELKSNSRPQSIQQWLELLNAKNSLMLSSPIDPIETISTRLLPAADPKAVSPLVAPKKPSQKAVAKQSGESGTAPRAKSLPVVVFPENWRCVHTLKDHSNMVHTVATSPNGQLVASGSNDSTIKLWQLDTGKLLRSLGGWFSGHSSMVHTVTFSPDGQVLASGSWDDTIKLWQVTTGREIRTLMAHSNWVNSLVFSPDGQLLASAGADSTIKLWQVSSGKQIRTFSGHSDTILSIAFSPDGKLLASVSADYTIKLWHVISGQEFLTFAGHSFYVNSIAWSNDGKILASGSSDKKIKLWQVSNGQEIRTFSGHSNAVSSVTFSPIPPSSLEQREPRGILASASWDQTIKLWQINTGKEICTLSGHSNYVRSVAFSPDGQTLVSGSDDNTVKVWQRD